MRTSRLAVVAAIAGVLGCATSGGGPSDGAGDGRADGDGVGDVPGEADGGCDPDACDAACAASGSLGGVCRDGACECLGGGDADADGGEDGDAGDVEPDDAGPEDAGPDGLAVDDDGDTFAETDGDCDDTDERIYPGSEERVDGHDADCDGRRDWWATIVVTADDAYDLCVNGVEIATGAEGHADAETYEVLVHAGRNVIGVHGYDTVGVTAGLSMWVGVAGMEIKTDGVLATEPDTTKWRYYPSEAEDPQATWCDVVFDDGDWGPALFNAEQDDGEWLANPNELRGRGVDWIWDGRPRDLREAWFRRRFDLPDDPPPVAAAGTDVCVPTGTPTILAMVDTDRLHNGVALAWTGTVFGAVWDEWYAPWRDGCDEVFLQRLDASGTPLGTPTRLTTGTWWNTFPDVVWGADLFAIANEDGQHDRNKDQIYLLRADASGVEVGADVRVTTTTGWAKHPAIDFDGTNFGLAWQDDRDGGAGAFEIYFARLSPAGTAVGPQLRLTSAAGSSRIPAIAWGGTRWAVAWEDVRDGNEEIYLTRVSAAGAEIGDDVRVTTNPAVSSAPSLAWSGTAWGLAWDDERDGNREIYFAVVAADGTVGAPHRVTTDGAISSDPNVVWNGAGWTLAWRDARDGNDEIYVARLAADGTRIGDDGRLTDSAGRSWHPDLVWTGTDYGVLWEEETDPAGQPYYFRAAFSRFSCP